MPSRAEKGGAMGQEGRHQGKGLGGLGFRGCYGTGGQAPREVQSRIKSSMSVEEIRSDSSDLSLHELG